MSENQLIAIKTLLEKAKSQLRKVGIERAFALLHAHDALDWTMQYLYQSAERKKSEMSFKNYAKYIADDNAQFGYFDKSKSDELDTMRNAFKHSFVLPNERRLQELVMWTEQQINSLLKVYLDKTLNNYDLINAVSLPDVKEELVEARAALVDGKKDYALAHRVTINPDNVLKFYGTSIKAFNNFIAQYE